MKPERIAEIAKHAFGLMDCDVLDDAHEAQCVDELEQAIIRALDEAFTEPATDAQFNVGWKVYCSSESPYAGFQEALSAMCAEKAKQWK